MFILKVIKGRHKGKFVANKRKRKGTWFLTDEVANARIFSSIGAIKLSFRGNYETFMWKKYYLDNKKFSEAMKNVPDYSEYYLPINVSLSISSKENE